MFQAALGSGKSEKSSLYAQKKQHRTKHGGVLAERKKRGFVFCKISTKKEIAEKIKKVLKKA